MTNTDNKIRLLLLTSALAIATGFMGILIYVIIVREITPMQVVGPPIKSPPMQYTPRPPGPVPPVKDAEPRNLMDEEAARQRERIRSAQVPD